ncbi:MAG: hypothetical protein A2491_17860 [Bacteroidetes bacterium RIFOXYC12_FULL_35_7]|nr:MAG: hypothetical protein A2491_17860 [Bacteroidetes bacterium RIFOXYC12_FULL_35_7]
MKIKILVCTIIVFSTVAGFSQNKQIDSLLQKTNNANNDSIRAALYIDIGKLYERKSLDTALVYFDKAKTLASKIKHRTLLAVSLNNYGRALSNRGHFDQALVYYNKSCALYQELACSLGKNIPVSVKTGLSDCYNNIGRIYYYQGNFNLSLEYYQKSLKIHEELCNSLDKATAMAGKKGAGICYNNIGNIHRELNTLSKALEYYKKSLDIKEELGDKKGKAGCYSNFGIVYSKKGDTVRTLEYFSKALNISQEIGDKKGVISGYMNIGTTLKNQKKYKQALEYMQMSLKIAKEINDKLAVAGALVNLSSVNLDLNNYDMAIEQAKNTLEIIKETGGVLSQKRVACSILKKAYKELGNFNKAFESAELELAIKDSMFMIEKTKAIAEMEAKYQTEKKEKENELLRQKEKNQQLLIQKKGYQLYGLIAITLLIMVITVLVVWQFKIWNKKKNVELKQKLLRSQINPHFLFNSLISIQNFMFEKNADDAAIYLSNFACLMRQILDNSREEYISVSEEKSLLENYLQLQKLRFESKFDFFIEIDPAIDLEFTAIPPMLAQPFIENSIEHGFSGMQNNNTIVIRFLKIGNSISFEIEDNGIGILQAGKKINERIIPHKSLATNITKERVHYLNKGKRKKVKFTIEDLSVITNEQKSGTKVSFTIPFQYIKS